MNKKTKEIYDNCKRLKHNRFSMHSLNGGHKPPFIKLCLKCHQDIHDIKPRKEAHHRKNIKIQKGSRDRKTLLNKIRRRCKK